MSCTVATWPTANGDVMSDLDRTVCDTIFISSFPLDGRGVNIEDVSTAGRVRISIDGDCDHLVEHLTDLCRQILDLAESDESGVWKDALKDGSPLEE